jgi:hypothetical protein
VDSGELSVCYELLTAAIKNQSPERKAKPLFFLTQKVAFLA